MSYAQRHRNRVELRQSELAQTPPDVSAASAAPPNGHTPVRLQDMEVDMRPQQQPPRGGSSPRRSSSSQRCWNGSSGPASDARDRHAARYPRPHSVTGASAVPWSETSSVGSAEVPRHPFQLLRHTPKHTAPPRLKASRKQFTSPDSSSKASEAAAGQPPAHASLRPRAAEKAVDERRRTSPPCQPDLLHGRPSTECCASRPLPAERDRCAYGQAQHASNESPPNGMLLPSPAPVFEASSATSSSRLSTSHWPASETFTARLRNIMETRERIERLVQKQRQDEEEMVHAIESLSEQSHCRSQPQQDDAADRPLYEQVLVERATAFAALRDFKERGNIIVRNLYATVMMQQEQALELVATVEALKKANKRLKDALSNGGGAASGGLDSGAGAAVTEGRATRAPDTVADLQEKVVMQRRVIEQMDQLMQNADRMLLAMRARVEAAEGRAGGATAECQQLPPRPLTPGSATPNSRSPHRAPVGEGGAVMVAAPDAEAAIERLMARYANDGDIATVSAQLRLLLGRAAQLRQALKREQAQRLHLEEVYGATYEETARNVALLEERLQRVQSTRGVIYNSSSSGSATNASALPTERRILVEERASDGGAAAADAMHREDKEQYTPPQTSSHPSSPTPPLTLFTVVSVADASTRAAITATASAAEDEDEEKEGGPKNSSGSADPAALEGVTAVPTDMKKKERHRSKSPQPSEPAVAQSARQSRAYLGDGRGNDGGANDDAAAEAQTLLLNIPVPDVSTLSASARHSLNSRSSSASRRLVGFRPAIATDVTSRCLGSGSDKEDYDDEVHVTVRSSGSNAQGGAAVTAAAISAVRQQPSNRQQGALDKTEA
ncbi:hypothetical protein JIQ42_00840 [Leishmania sp. Namibia]|uniref:hypothetical protein n=1 Tax=Leishmania sp. Namibia TaxID=2802991 RepID=UPI001B4B5A9B|nr:hypothetical protein JIQ42_00840 [Leishmania sp. Namibia]